MVVMPADHLIQPDAAFQAAIRQAVAIVEQQPETLVTFGIKPTYAAESFGYIETRPASSEVRAQAVMCMRCTLSRKAGQERRGGVFGQRQLLLEQRHLRVEGADDSGCDWPAMSRRCASTWRRFKTHVGKPDFAEVLDREFTAIRGKSIDFAVMEHYQPVVVIEAPFTWDDVGSWQALARSVGADEAATRSIGKHLGIRTERSHRAHERRSPGRDAGPEGHDRRSHARCDARRRQAAGRGDSRGRQGAGGAGVEGVFVG